MEIKFKKLTPDLMVDDVAKTVKFYTKKLGFNVAVLVPEGDKDKPVYAMVVRDEIFMMFMQKDVYEADVIALKGVDIGASATLYCDVDNVDALYDSFKKNGVEFVKEISVTWYGMKEFYIKDCNGYILGFAEQSKK